MKLPDKHNPVLLNEVIAIFKQIQNNFDELICIDCTLGQAGHSFEIFKNLKRGVLLSIDLFIDSIEWTAKTYGFQSNRKQENGKQWILVNDKFSNLDQILKDESKETFDFLLADLGFSNLELISNLGISYSSQDQILDMRYGNTELKASDILNNFSNEELFSILKKYSDIPENLIDAMIKRVLSFRKTGEFKKVYDVNKALGNISSKVLAKLFQVLRIVVNQEDMELQKLTEIIKSRQSENGVSLIITFNNFEEEILQKSFGKHEIVEPNIKEIISNPQSRSAKLHIYKTKSKQ